jgi:hypothetical protein
VKFFGMGSCRHIRFLDLSKLHISMVFWIITQ